MTESSALLKKLQRAVSEHDDETLRGAIEEALDSGIETVDMRRAVVSGLDEVRRKLMSNAASIPDFLLCIDTTIEGLGRLSPTEVDEDGTPLVIGVVKGDPHDLGKNIVTAIYRAYGYRVVDLGREVPNERFVRAVEDNSAAVLALSAMMSTTAMAMREIIAQVKAKAPDVVVMVGGAPLDETLAKKYGADGYAESAVTVLEETEAAVRRVQEGKSCIPSS